MADHQPREAAIRLYREGASMNAAGKAVGVHGQTVERWLTSAGVPIRQRRVRYSEATHSEALRLYAQEELSCAEVASRLGLRCFTVKDWVAAAGIARTMSEAAAISTHARPRAYRGAIYVRRSTLTGRDEFAASSYEIARMVALDAEVTTWARCADRIAYVNSKGRKCFYVPDFEVVARDGRRRIEEIKPRKFLTRYDNPAKFAAAQAHYAALGIAFVVVTEEQIGRIDSWRFEAFRPDAAARAKRRAGRRKVRERNMLAQETSADRKSRLSRLAAKRRRARAAKNSHPSLTTP